MGRTIALPVIWGGLLVLCAGAFLQTPADGVAASQSALIDAAANTPAASSAAASNVAAGAISPAKYYDLWTLAPAVLAIILAITLRQVIPAMVLGILLASFMMQPLISGEGPLSGGAMGLMWYVIGSVRLCFEHYILGAYSGPSGSDHLRVVLFTLAIGGMIGVMEAGGGTRAIVNHVARFASNRRGGQLSAWFAGLLVFFDDYANCLIIGPTMRPVFDRLRISRQKLAYIIDATASCVASVMISTWLATEISMIDKGLREATVNGALPTFLQGATGFSIFWASIPYRHYVLLALIMVFLVALTRRDFGPMLKAEREAYLNPPPERDADPYGTEHLSEQPGHDGGAGGLASAGAGARRGRAWYAVVPIFVIVAGMMGLLLATGWGAGSESYQKMVADGLYKPASALAGGTRWMIEILGKGDTYSSILYAGLAALTIAILINLGTGAANVTRTFNGMMSGMTHVFPALCVLTLAWALSAATGKDGLQLSAVAVKYVNSNLPAKMLPLATFLSAALVAFATGTSWGTINILCPVATTVGAAVAATMEPTSPGQAQEIFLATVGAVLAGACFGDHCSPLNDSTVMAALVSECSLESHVWTQLPYALVTMATTVFIGDILLRHYEQPWWVGLLAGTVVLLFVLLIFGRRADAVRAEPAR
ncbi:MAG: Na+/H+ antiporter NhaC family protein [Phycisphaerae bacterium]|nr:Na+/H+ antiporter NhaC family protein [Phycisphaerae bacterium]